MQFTGLKDKTGKEIYEGDVLKCFHYDLLYQAVWLEDELRFALRNTKNPTPFNTCCIGEIIGNIYENPELLQ